MVGTVRAIMAVGVLVLAGGAVIGAANVDKALVETDGRRNAAETGVREIKAKAKDQVDQVRPLYIEAASRNNAWLDTVSQAIQQGTSTAPDISATVEPAASALVAWVSARNRALGVADLTGTIADSVKKRVIADLTEIANATWRSNRGGNEQKRTKSADALKERLRWRSWEEVR
jgi:N-acetylglucosamine kinase-like BadF-type ATPase